MSITKRYFTSLFSARSNASLICWIGIEAAFLFDHEIDERGIIGLPVPPADVI
jgi:hypothetical protein